MDIKVVFTFSMGVVLLGSWMYGGPFFGSNAQPILKSSPLSAPPFTLLINPAGDAQQAGREIDGTYERGITMQAARELKKALEEQTGNVRVVLTRYPGEAVEPLQNASFANRLNVDLYVSLHFFEHTQKNPTLFIYYLSYNPLSDLWDTAPAGPVFLPYEQAYSLSIKKTKIMGEELFERAKQIGRSYGVLCHKPCGIPFKPLMGITAPALAFECGIRKKDDWKKLIPFFVTILEPLISKQRGTWQIG